MSSTTTISLQSLNELHDAPQRSRLPSEHSATESVIPLRPADTADITEQQQAPPNAFEAVPDGGYGWAVVAACAVFLFWTNGFTVTWGVLQTAILSSSYLDVNSSQITWVGGLALATMVGLGVPSIRFFGKFGARNSCVLAALILSSGPILASFTLHNLAGLFLTYGLLVGSAASILYTASNSVTVQWFSSKLGRANGFIKAGGGVGATILPITAQKLIDAVGLPWAFRIFGFLMLATVLPAAVLIRERSPATNRAQMPLSTLFRNTPLICITVGGALTVFALFVPPFFLPLFCHSIGLSATTGAGLVAGFGASTTVGRLLSGVSCDRIGPINTLVITVLTNAITMLVIWPVSDELAPLVLFAALNGAGNGSFFVALPTTIAAIVGPGLASSAMSIGTTFWAPGYLVGTSIAGILIASSGAEKASTIGPYRAAIFYAGSIAMAGGLFALFARFKMDRKLNRKI